MAPKSEDLSGVIMTKPFLCTKLSSRGLYGPLSFDPQVRKLTFRQITNISQKPYGSASAVRRAGGSYVSDANEVFKLTFATPGNTTRSPKYAHSP
jgi:hypothetical protein